MTNMIAEIEKSAEEMLAALVAKASTTTMAKKLRNLHEVCRHLVTKTEERLTVPAVLRHYAGRVTDPAQGLSEQTIRNKRPNGNPYMDLYRAWERVAEAKAAAKPSRRDGGGLSNGDLYLITDPTMRHRVSMMMVQNKSLQNQLDMMRKLTAPRPS
jgi:hypothetical protein